MQPFPLKSTKGRGVRKKKEFGCLLECTGFGVLKPHLGFGWAGIKEIEEELFNVNQKGGCCFGREKRKKVCHRSLKGITAGSFAISRVEKVGLRLKCKWVGFKKGVGVLGYGFHECW